MPSHLYGRVVSVAMVLAWSAIPLGALVGAAAIQLTGSPVGVYAVTGALTAVIAILFGFSAVRHGDRYLADASASAPGAGEPAEAPT